MMPRAAYRRRILIRLHGIQVVHHDNHRFGLLLGDQVIQDEIDVALRVPALLVFAPAVKQVENRVAVARIGRHTPAACRRNSGAICP